MATITISINAGAQNYSLSRTITGAHLTTFLNAYKQIHGQVIDTPATEDAPATYRDMTNQEVFDVWAKGILQGTMNNVNSQQEHQAVITAKAALTPIVLT